MKKFISPIAHHQSAVDNAKKLFDLVRPNTGIWIDGINPGSRSQGETYEQEVLKKLIDNLRSADIFNYEVKTSRSKAKNCRIRLFCNATDHQKELLALWGKPNSSGLVIFNKSFSNARNNKKSLPTSIVLTPTHVFLMLGPVVFDRITRAKYLEIFKRKIPNFAPVPADQQFVPGRDGKAKEQFRFWMPICLAGFREDVFWQYVEDGYLSVEFRLRGKDYGTSNNLNANHLKLMYDLTVTEDGKVVENPWPLSKAQQKAARDAANESKKIAKVREREIARAEKAALNNNAKLALAA